MDKLKMHSVNKVDENIEKIGALFPNALTEVIKGYMEDGTAIIEHAIDFEVLKQELSNVVVEGPEERYHFTWPDKKKSILLANAPIAKTLRPCREESVDFDSTENLYIEGDNLDVLKLLQETYLGKVKMIYIDPPYNTGNDFVYEDDFAQDTHEYLANSGQYDEEGNRLVQNTESNGRFHTDWLNMMYPRLKLAKDLLSDDGVIFLSVDDNESANLKKVCDEIFGISNALIPLIWDLPRGNNAGIVARAHEYVLVYAKDINSLKHFNRLASEEDSINIERCNRRIDSRHPATPIRFPAGIRYEGEDKTFTGKLKGNEEVFIEGELVFKDGKLAKDVTLHAGWNMKEMFLKWLRGEKVYDLKGQQVIDFFFKSNGKLYSVKKLGVQSLKSVLKNYPDTQNARSEMAGLFNGKELFDFNKPVGLIRNLTKLVTSSNSIVLDFFSGSATTAHAVMQLNAEDGGNRKFIMVQLPEETDEKSEAFKAGYKNICEIGKERIRRAGTKILEEHPEVAGKLDLGFRVLQVDSTNMQDVYYSPAEYKQDEILLFADNIKPDRTPQDLLFQVMLDLGVLLSSKIEEITISDKKVFNVADGYLLACFDSNITSEVITEIAKKQPYYAVFRDSSIASDSVATNFEQIFETYSPTTVRKVL